MRALLLATLAMLAASGCVGPQTNAGDFVPAPTEGGSMTAKETREESAELCSGGLDLTGPDRFCAKRVLRVEGTIAGMSRMEVALSTFNGGVTVIPSKEGEWGLEAVLRASAATADEAKARLDDIAFQWSHVEGAGHFLEATARRDGSDGHGYSASLEAKLPRSIAYMLVATTSNGAVKIDGLRTEALAAHTSNGPVDVTASVGQVELATSNGEVKARLDPVASGRIVATTSNGRITLTLPETSDRGYDLEGTTSNGKVDITLRDGKVGDCPAGSQYYTPPCTHRTFRTSGFESRAIRSHVTLTTSNGEVKVSPS